MKQTSPNKWRDHRDMGKSSIFSIHPLLSNVQREEIIMKCILLSISE